jgi:hypothetical protein
MNSLGLPCSQLSSYIQCAILFLALANRARSSILCPSTTGVSTQSIVSDGWRYVNTTGEPSYCLPEQTRQVSTAIVYQSTAGEEAKLELHAKRSSGHANKGFKP